MMEITVFIIGWQDMKAKIETRVLITENANVYFSIIQ